MIICEICTGRHPTSACAIAQACVEQCFTGTVDDYEPLPANVVPLPMFRGKERREVQHWSPRVKGVSELRAGTHIGRPSRSISATRLA